MDQNFTLTSLNEELPSFNEFYDNQYENKRYTKLKKCCVPICTCSNLCNSMTNLVNVSILGINIYMAYAMRKFFLTMYDVLEIAESIIPPLKET